MHFIEIKDGYIQNVDYILEVTSIVATAMVISMVIMIYDSMLSKQRESILALLNIYEKMSNIPVIGEIKFYFKFDKFSILYIIIKYIARTIQIFVLAYPFSTVFQYIFDKISDIIDKTDYAKFQGILELNKTLIAVVALELIIIFISAFINIHMTRRVCRTRALGIIISMCPIIGYFIMFWFIRTKNIAYYKGRYIRLSELKEKAA